MRVMPESCVPSWCQEEDVRSRTWSLYLGAVAAHHPRFSASAAWSRPEIHGKGCARQHPQYWGVWGWGSPDGRSEKSQDTLRGCLRLVLVETQEASSGTSDGSSASVCCLEYSLSTCLPELTEIASRKCVGDSSATSATILDVLEPEGHVTQSGDTSRPLNANSKSGKRHDKSFSMRRHTNSQLHHHQPGLFPSPMTQTVHGLPDVGSHGIWLDLEEELQQSRLLDASACLGFSKDFVSCDDKLQEVLCCVICLSVFECDQRSSTGARTTSVPLAFRATGSGPIISCLDRPV